MNLDETLRAELDRLEAASLLRQLRPAPLSKPGAPHRPDFASNDYLGLSQHPALIEAAQKAVAVHGTGAGASRLITGTSREVLELEDQLAVWKQTEAALVFGSGYAAALGTIPALVGRGDTVILDKLSHASLVDAARLSGATVRVIPHHRLDRLENLLTKLSLGRGRILLVTESLFSMDGDEAPLAGWVELKERHGAWLLVDEAHATALYGKTGAGLVAATGLSGRVDIVMGTLSKALGGVGGYIAGSRTLIDFLVNRARSFIYSTALPPAAIAASAAAIVLAQSEAGHVLREKLAANIASFRAHLPGGWSSRVTGAIQPLACSEAMEAVRLSLALREHGYFVPAIRYPTVGRNAARLRLTLSASRTIDEVQQLTSVLNAIGPTANSTG